MVVRKFDLSIEMVEDIITVEKETFKEITLTVNEFCNQFENWPNYDLYVAYIDDESAGFVGMMRAVTPHYKGWWIDLLAVLPKYQNNGIATELIAFVKSSYKTKDSVVTALTRNNKLPSIKAVEKNDFKSDAGVNPNLFILD